MHELSRRRALQLAGGSAAVALTFGLSAATTSSVAAAAYPVPSRQAWWYQARFGMFIHFGSYSYRGRGEWAFSNENWGKADYQTYVSANFNPTSFNAADIVGYAKSAGMKYLVITAKHHEGFAMWDSKVASFTDVTGTKPYTLPGFTPYKVDLLGALKAECDRQGIRFGLYYSILDWCHSSQTIYKVQPIFSSMASAAARASYITDMKAQLRELITRYDPAIMWFDGDWCGDPATPTATDWWIKSDGQSLFDFLLGLKPDLVINERVKRDLGLGDFECPEQFVPGAPLARAWETNATMNDSWGYDASKDGAYRSATTLIRELTTVVSRDGNYLLNIGPKGDGTVLPAAVSTLAAIGQWTTTYGDAIYGATGSPYPTEPSWGKVTKKPGKVFALVHNWPANGTLAIPGLQNTINRVYLLNAPNTDLPYTVGGGSISVTVPTTAPNASVSVVVVDVVGDPAPGSGTGGGIVSGGTYKLVNSQSGKALDDGSSTTDGTPVMQWRDTGVNQQKWTFTDVGGGSWKLVCRHSGKALDNGSVTGEGDGVMQWRDTGVNQQKWAVTDAGGGTYTLQSRYSAKYLDTNGSTTDGTTVVQRTGSGSAAQRWRIVRAD